MSNQNENINPQKSSELISIDETGKVVINSPELAKMTDELSAEELDAVAGGAGVNIFKCYCPPAESSEKKQSTISASLG